MALRLVQVDVPENLAADATGALEQSGAAELWSSPGGAYGVVVSAVMGAERTGPAVDLVYGRLAGEGALRVLVLPLDAVIPRPAASLQPEARRQPVSAEAVSREEVYASISGSAKLSPLFLAMVLLATVVAAIGLSQDNTAAVIGAMVVAPLLGPNMALALGLTLGDRPLVVRAARSSLVGALLCFASSVLLASVIEVDPGVRELASRARAGLGDVVLAVAAGTAGTLAYGSGAPTYLVGVMVAVALLPPTVASGLFLGNGYVGEAVGAALLAAINGVALVLAAILTFLARGMRPRAWWVEERARRSARRGALVLAGLLAVLFGLILLSARVLEGGSPP